MKELTPLLEKLADKLGTTVEHLWSVLLQQAQIDAQIWQMWMVVWMCVFGGLAVISIFLAFIGSREKWELWGVWFIVTGLSFVIGIPVFIGCYSAIITRTQNPEYWALKEILRHL